MASLRRRRRLRSVGGPLLAFGLAVLLTPAPARATCGDYVTFAGQAHRAMDHAPQTDHRDAPAAPARPCSGPHCSRGPLAPPAAPAVKVMPVREWAAITSALHGEDPGRPEALRADPPVRPVRHALPIYHPPRPLPISRS